METALHLAALKGHSGVVKSLLGTGADINAVDSEGRIALHWAAYYGHGGVVKSLLDTGAGIKAADSKGWVALHWRPRMDIAEWSLLDAGADIKAVDSQGLMALHRASNRGGKSDEYFLKVKKKLIP